ncbi:MAG: putative endopeptidase p60 [Firmicutes bacterium]|nr:putative endopeptidase p60 [Bacillota bacterium]
MKLNWQKAMAILALALTVALVPLPAIASANGARGARVVSVALNYLGRPYVFGATEPRTFDCSGFTRYVMNRPGVSHVGIALGNGRMVHA